MVPARMVNEFVYCPRLAYLMWAQSEWAESAETIEGQRAHTRVNRPGRPLPSPDAMNEEADSDETPVVSRSVTLSSATLGLVAKLDIAEARKGFVTPIEYKRGKRPHVARGAYEPERIQVCLQGLLLEEHGYRVEEGIIFFAGSKERVRVTLDEELRSAARRAINDLRNTVAQNRLPPPLKDSPKCPRCALVSVCLPDEIQMLLGSDLAPRQIAVPRDTALPLIVQSQHARISKDGETLKIIDEEQGEKRVRLIDVSDIALFGNIYLTTPALSALFEREIPVTYHSHGGWFRGVAHGIGHRNVEVRTAQYRMSFDDPACLRFARSLVAAKITNQRTIFRRNWKGEADDRQTLLNTLKMSSRRSAHATSTEALLGVEGTAAAAYFSAFNGLLHPPPRDAEIGTFQFEKRNRRPPSDPVNALLSFGYAMLTRHLTVAVASVGLDPYRGFFHAPRYGRPSLALDLMEPFRPIITDSVVVSAINNGEIGATDFVTGVTGTALTQSGRRRFIKAFERRLNQEATHPVFGYRLSMRRMLLVQVRLLCRFLLGEIPDYPHYLPR